jgi:hypothetical protein
MSVPNTFYFGCSSVLSQIFLGALGGGVKRNFFKTVNDLHEDGAKDIREGKNRSDDKLLFVCLSKQDAAVVVVLMAIDSY